MLRHPRPRSSSSEHDHASWLKDAEHTRAVFDFELSVQTMQCFPHILFDDAPCGSEPGGKIRGPCRGHASMLLNGHVIPSYLFSLGCWSWWSPHLLSEIHPRKAPPILFSKACIGSISLMCVCAREFVSLLAVQNSQYKCELQCWTLSCSTQSLVLLCQDSRRAKGRDSSIQRTTRTSSRYISKHEWVNKGHQGSQLLKLQTHNARVVNRKGRWMLVASTSSDFFLHVCCAD